MFKDFHYLDNNLNKASRCYIAMWDGKIVGFSATMTMPSGTLKNAWRNSRLVVLPDYQGLGIGPRLADAVAQIHIDQGHRFYARSAHIRLIMYRTNSELWKPSSKNKKLRTDIKHDKVYKGHYADNKRICGSFEYIGKKKEGE